jgi:hypothetical protein
VKNSPVCDLRIIDDPEQKSKRGPVFRYPMGVWDPSVIVRAARESLERAEAAFCDDQSVRGLDSLSEIRLHPLVETGLTHAGLGVHREVAYPTSNEFVPKNSARMRCDLVLTEKPGMVLYDPIAEQKLLEQATGTLFAGLAHEISPERVGTDPSDCYWIEVKSVAQYAYVDGVPAANSGYARELIKGPVADITKIASEPAIWQAGMMVLLFAESETVIEHDITQLVHECLNHDLPVGSPEIESFAISDRAGNTVCGIGLIPIKL